MQNNGLVKGVK